MATGKRTKNKKGAFLKEGEIHECSDFFLVWAVSGAVYFVE